jgi:hypothetical protein
VIFLFATIPDIEQSRIYQGVWLEALEAARKLAERKR